MSPYYKESQQVKNARVDKTPNDKTRDIGHKDIFYRRCAAPLTLHEFKFLETKRIGGPLQR